jgi:hypothetical protein
LFRNSKSQPGTVSPIERQLSQTGEMPGILAERTQLGSGLSKRGALAERTQPVRAVQDRPGPWCVGRNEPNRRATHDPLGRMVKGPRWRRPSASCAVQADSPRQSRRRRAAMRRGSELRQSQSLDRSTPPTGNAERQSSRVNRRCFDGKIAGVRHHRKDVSLVRDWIWPLWSAVHVECCGGPNDKHCDTERDRLHFFGTKHFLRSSALRQEEEITPIYCNVSKTLG